MMKKKAVEKVDQFYGSFFESCRYFALSPYLKVIELNDGDSTAQVWACIGLTLFIPILPALTIITATLAFVGVLLEMLSAVITYPIAQLIDACSDDEESSYGYGAAACV